MLINIRDYLSSRQWIVAIWFILFFQLFGALAWTDGVRSGLEDSGLALLISLGYLFAFNFAKKRLEANKVKNGNT